MLRLKRFEVDTICSFVAKGDTRFALSKILIHRYKNGATIMAASDTHRLVELSFREPDDSKPTIYMVSPAMLKAVLLKSKQREVSRYRAAYVNYNSIDFRYLVQKLPEEDKFPDYTKFFSTKGEVAMVLTPEGYLCTKGALSLTPNLVKPLIKFAAGTGDKIMFNQIKNDDPYHGSANCGENKYRFIIMPLRLPETSWKNLTGE